METCYKLMKVTLMLMATWAAYVYIISTGFDNPYFIYVPLANTLFYGIFLYHMAIDYLRSPNE